MKKTLMVTIGLCAIASMAMAQTITVSTFGISQRDIDSSRVDVTLDVPYNGLTNVGIGTKMYFKGFFGDSTFADATWDLTGPATSGATVGTPIVVDTATQLVVVTPDSIGSYTLTLTQGGLSGEIVFTAGKYVGNDFAKTGNSASCSTCHNDKFTAWQTTGHSDALVRGLDGLKGSYFASYCVSCHSTGYDANADNDGFDDWAFETGRAQV